MKSIFWRIFLGFIAFGLLMLMVFAFAVHLNPEFNPPPRAEDQFIHLSNFVLRANNIPSKDFDETVFKEKLERISSGPEKWYFYSEFDLPEFYAEFIKRGPLRPVYFIRFENRIELIRKIRCSPDKIGYIVSKGPLRMGLFETFSSYDGLLLLRIFIVVSVAVSLCYLLSRSLVNPLIKLKKTSILLGAKDLSVRLEKDLIERQDEIGELARDFNRMAENIENLIRNQKKLFHEISHEFKSPLTRLQLSLETIEINEYEKYSEEIDRMKLECFRIKSLTDQILSIAKIDSGYIGEEQTISTVELISELISDLEIEAKAKNVKLKLSGEKVEKITTYPFLLKRACENVIRNSIKFSPDDSEIDIRVSTALIAVRDYGPGVAEDKLPTLLKPFTGDMNHLGEVNTGLGLSIVNRIVKRLGGEVILKNADPGGFIVELRFRS